MQDTAPTTPTPTTPITLSEAAALCPRLNKRRLHNSTLWRWCRRGCKGANGKIVRLAHKRVGGTLCTTPAALEAFFQELADADLEQFRKRDDSGDGPAPAATVGTPRKPRKPTREAAITAAKDRLKAAGF